MAWKFNAPPGWPEPLDGWIPLPGWTPDPSWPAPPEGWQFWVSVEGPPPPPITIAPPAAAPATAEAGVTPELAAAVPAAMGVPAAVGWPAGTNGAHANGGASGTMLAEPELRPATPTDTGSNVPVSPSPATNPGVVPGLSGDSGASLGFADLGAVQEPGGRTALDDTNTIPSVSDTAAHSMARHGLDSTMPAAGGYRPEKTLDPDAGDRLRDSRDDLPVTAVGSKAPPPPEDGEVQRRGRRPWYRRWWAVAAAVIGVLAVIGAVAWLVPYLNDRNGDSGGTAANQPAAPPSAVASDVPSAPAAPAVPPPDQVFEGTGDETVPLQLTEGVRHMALITHLGSANLVVNSLDSAGDEIALVVNEVGAYTGVSPLDFEERPAALKVETEGDWRITVQAAEKAPEWDGSAKGSNPAVLRVSPETAADASTVNITHQGESNFVVTAYGETDELLANEVGDFTGQATLPAGATFLVVQADGDWTIETGTAASADPSGAADEPTSPDGEEPAFDPEAPAEDPAGAGDTAEGEPAATP